MTTRDTLEAMLKIRLKRVGKRNQPHYRIVVAEARSARGGRPIAEIGTWNPGKEKPDLKKEAYETWLQKGALPTEAVRSLINEKTT